MFIIQEWFGYLSPFLGSKGPYPYIESVINSYQHKERFMEPIPQPHSSLETVEVTAPLPTVEVTAPPSYCPSW